MWLVSCRRQGMLTQGPAPDPKCKLNISSFLTLPLLLDCLICTRNSVSIVLLLWMMWGCYRWGLIDYYQGVGVGTGGGCCLTAFFQFVLLSFDPSFLSLLISHVLSSFCFSTDLQTDRKPKCSSTINWFFPLQPRFLSKRSFTGSRSFIFKVECFCQI